MMYRVRKLSTGYGPKATKIIFGVFVGNTHNYYVLPQMIKNVTHTYILAFVVDRDSHMFCHPKYSGFDRLELLSTVFYYRIAQKSGGTKLWRIDALLYRPKFWQGQTLANMAN